MQLSGYVAQAFRATDLQAVKPWIETVAHTKKENQKKYHRDGGVWSKISEIFQNDCHKKNLFNLVTTVFV
jgi:hypothetical protein